MYKYIFDPLTFNKNWN